MMQKHSRNKIFVTLLFFVLLCSIVKSSRQGHDAANYHKTNTRVEKWPPEKVADWVSTLIGDHKGVRNRILNRKINGEFFLRLSRNQYEHELGIHDHQHQILLEENIRRLNLREFDDCDHPVSEWSHTEVMDWANSYFGPHSDPITVFFLELRLNGAELLKFDHTQIKKRQKLKSFHKKKIRNAMKHLKSLNDRCLKVIGKGSALLDSDDKDPSLWDNSEVVAWLEVNGLKRFKEMFKKNLLNGEALISLKKEQLSELGIMEDPYSEKLLKSIHRLASTSNNRVYSEQMGSKYGLKSPDVWSSSDVADWVFDIGEQLQGYGILFVENGIDGKILLILDDQDLEEIGISKVIHRKTILNKVKALAEENNSQDYSKFEEIKSDNIEVEVFNRLGKMVSSALISSLLGFSALFWKKLGMTGRSILCSAVIVTLAILFQRNYHQICAQNQSACDFIEKPSLLLEKIKF